MFGYEDELKEEISELKARLKVRSLKIKELNNKIELLEAVVVLRNEVIIAYTDEVAFAMSLARQHLPSLEAMTQSVASAAKIPEDKSSNS